MTYKLSKFIYILFIFYIGYFQHVFFQVSNMPLALGIGMILFLVLYIVITSEGARIVITKPIFIWVFFSFYLLLSGIFVAHNKIHLVNSLITYIQILAMMIYIINISLIEGNNDFFLKTYCIYSIIYMITMLLWGYDGPGGRLQLSATSNPNSDGLTLLFGIFCILTLINPKKLKRLIGLLGIVGLFIYTIILTGSRKSFFTAISLVLLYFIYVFKNYWKSYTIIKKIISTLILLIILTLIIILGKSYFYDSVIYQRLSTGSGYSLVKARSEWANEAIRLFNMNPIFGVGFNHYRILSIFGTYSHSTYLELISTTGIIGTLIYFSAYIVIIYNLFYIYKKTKGTKSSIKALLYLILMFIMIILGTVVIHFYDIDENIMFSLMISFYYIEKIKLKQENKTKLD